MTILLKPELRPANPHFSSGPCAKPPNWQLSELSDAPLGRSHRAAIGRQKLTNAIEETRSLLKIPFFSNKSTSPE